MIAAGGSTAQLPARPSTQAYTRSPPPLRQSPLPPPTHTLAHPTIMMTVRPCFFCVDRPAPRGAGQPAPTYNEAKPHQYTTGCQSSCTGSSVAPSDHPSAHHHHQATYNETEALHALRHLVRYRKVFQQAINPDHRLVGCSVCVAVFVRVQCVCCCCVRRVFGGHGLWGRRGRGRGGARTGMQEVTALRRIGGWGMDGVLRLAGAPRPALAAQAGARAVHDVGVCAPWQTRQYVCVGGGGGMLG